MVKMALTNDRLERQTARELLLIFQGTCLGTEVVDGVGFVFTAKKGSVRPRALCGPDLKRRENKTRALVRMRKRSSKTADSEEPHKETARRRTHKIPERKQSRTSLGAHTTKKSCKPKRET